MCSSARPLSPSSRKAAPRLVWAIASSGRDSRTARNAPAASAWRPRTCKARPRLLRTAGSSSPSRIASTTAGDGLFELAQGTMDLGQRGVEDGHIGAQGHCLADQLGGQASLALLMTQHPQEVKSVGMGSIAVQDRLIKASRRVQVARLVKPDRSGKFVARDRDHDTSRLFQNPGRHCPIRRFRPCHPCGRERR